MSGKHSVDVGRFTLRLHDVTLPIGLEVAQVDLTGAGLHLEPSPLVVEASEPGELEAVVTAAALAAFLERQSPAGLRNFQISIRDQRLYIDAVKNLLVDIPAKAVCNLRIVDETKVFVELESVDVMGAGAKNLVQTQLDRLNPVIDAADFPVRARFLSIDADEDRLLIRGTISPP